MKKVIVTGDPYSSLKLIQALKQRGEEHVHLCERRAQVRVKDEDILFWYVPHWQCEEQIERECYETDACLLVVHDGCYDGLPRVQPIYDKVKQDNGRAKLIMVNDEPADEKECERLAQQMGADYIHLPLDPFPFQSVACKVASMI